MKRSMINRNIYLYLFIIILIIIFFYYFTNNKNKIPRIIHQIWVGPNPIPEKSKKFIEKIKELHPNFEYRLWNDNDINEKNFKNVKYINDTKSYAQKADIMRLEILYNYGGIYIDIDIEVIKNLEPLLTNELIVCNEDSNINKYMSTGFIASTKDNINLKNTVDNINKVDFTQEINIATGPTYFRKNIVINNNVTVLPTKFIYPIPYGTEVSKESLNNVDLSESYAIHHWDKNW